MFPSKDATSSRLLRAHKKSRSGCRRCKNRRVKCDERHPVCGNCSRRFGSLEPCQFDVPLPTSTYEITSSLTTSYGSPVRLQRASPAPALTLRPWDNMRILELKLFHHYTSITSSTMPQFGLTELDQLFKMQVPQLCFAFDTVLSTVLGVAALHYLSLDPNNYDMKRAAQLYMGQTVRQHSQLVSNITKENAEPALLVAMLIVMAVQHRAAYLQEGEPYKLPLEYFHMHDGAAIVYHMCLPHLRGNNVLVAMGVETPRFAIPTRTREFLPSLIWQDSLALLDGLDVVGIDPNLKSVYEHYLSYLDIIYMALLREENSQWTRRRLQGMPGNMPRDFVKLLEQQDPRSMAILARFFSLMKMCDGERYFRGTAEYEVYGNMSLMPEDWLWAMEWPVRVLTLSKLADCEVQLIETDHQWLDNRIMGKVDYRFDTDRYLDTPSSGESLPSGRTTPISSSCSSTSPTFELDRGTSGSGISLVARRRLEICPVEKEKVLLESNEILARQCASLRCSPEEYSQISPHLRDQIIATSADDI